jgi:hypothetical protein
VGQTTKTVDGVTAQGVHVHRAGSRWVVRAHCGGAAADGTDDVGIVDDADDLISALVLADLLSPEVDPGPRPPRTSDLADEAERLRVAVRQLEHALAARVTVEQAIGVIAERGQLSVRDAFEMLRKVARSQGTRVHDLSKAVVASVTDLTVALPGDFPRRSS